MTGPCPDHLTARASPGIGRAFAAGRAAGPLLMCGLALAMIASGAWLYQRRAARIEARHATAAFVASLETLSAEELDRRAAALRAHPDDARRLMSPVLRLVRRGDSPARARWAGARLLTCFIEDEPRLAERLFALRTSPDETLAALCVTAAARRRPASLAAEDLGRCLREPLTPSAIDAACDGLLDLGPPGRDALRSALPQVSAQRRAWLVGYIAHRAPPDRAAWLELFEHDESEIVRARLRSAASMPAAPGAHSRGAPPGFFADAGSASMRGAVS